MRRKVPVNNILVMAVLLPEREGERKEEWNRLKGPNFHLNVLQVNQISSCQQTYDKAISLKAAAVSVSPYHP